MPLLSDSIDSRSRWFVGSSNRRTFAPESIIFISMQRTLSPPERTFAFFVASSPENISLPSQPLTSLSKTRSEYLLTQSISESSQPSKNSELSDGKYDCDVVTPHLKVPSSGSSSPTRILKSVVFASPSVPTKATFSRGFIVNETLSRTFLSPIVLLIPVTVSSSLPTSRSGLNETKGKRRDETGISSILSSSRSFLRLVACFDFEAFALNRAINSCNSFFFCSAFLFCSLS